MGDAEAKDAFQEEPPAEPEPPNPFSQLTDQELEEYKQEVERKKLGLQGTSQGGERGLHGSQSPFWGLQPSDQVDGKSVCLQARRMRRWRKARDPPKNHPRRPHRRARPKARPRRPPSPRRVSGVGNTRKPSGEEQGVFIQLPRQGDKGGLQQNPPETQI